MTVKIGDKMDKNKANVPKIRFPGFTDPWEQRKVKDIFKVTRGYVLAATETTDKKTDEMHYPVYSSQTKDNGLMGYYKDFLYENAITWTTDGANAGTVNYRDGKFYCTNVCGVLLSDDGYANKMVSEALNNISWKHVSKVGNPKLMNNVMSEIVVSLPKTIEEQNIISDLLNRLDNLITLHQRKLNHLQDKKKSLLQKMFPKNGECFPELRFPGFTDPWEQRKLSDGTSKIGDGLHGTPEFKDTGDVYFINGNNLVNGNIEITEETKRVSYIEQSDDDKTLDCNTILMSINGTIGNLAWYSGEKIMLGKSTAFIKIRDFNKKYIYYYLQTSAIHEYFFNNLTGTTIKNLGLKTIRETIIDVPSIGEQLKIGQFFEQLDNLITLNQRKLNHLKEQKKSLLQQMFA